MASPEDEAVPVTRQELADALKQWDVDAAANSWDQRTDEGKYRDVADYLIHTIRLKRGEGETKPKED